MCKIKTKIAKGFVLGTAIAISVTACTSKNNYQDQSGNKEVDSLTEYVAQRLPIYEKVRLSTDVNLLTPNERKVLPLLIEAAQIMDELFWKQAYPQRDSLLATIKDEKTREFIFSRSGFAPSLPRISLRISLSIA